MNNTTFKFNVEQRVRFGTQASIFEVYSRFAPDDGSEYRYYLKSVTTPSYLQWALESDLSADQFYEQLVTELIEDAFSEDLPKSYVKQGEVHDWLVSISEEKE